jgi:ribosomal protein S18 acetylase RimI-like enzyme
MSIRYASDADGVTPEQLEGFFEGWPKAPSCETHLRILQGSDEVVLAIDDETGAVVGFVTAVTDGVLSAYVPLLEVLPAYRRRGIARELVTRLLDALGGYYMIDLVCDEALVRFYEQLGFRRMRAMAIRDYDAQSGLG